MSLYGTLIKQEADYTTLLDEKIPECEQIVQVIYLEIIILKVKLDYLSYDA